MTASICVRSGPCIGNFLLVAHDTSDGSEPKVLIAVNAHQAHDPADILASCQSVGRALARLQQARPASRARAVLYTDAADRLGQEGVLARITALGLGVEACPGASNGERLNRQIAAAIAAGDDLFLRVDGDDTVSENRFVHQVGLFGATQADILGGGLTYVQGGAGRPSSGGFDVIPPESPRALDYVFNRFMLHPTLGLRVASLSRTGLRYWDQRLEDKEFLLRATALGLRMQNAPEIYGTYFVHAKARNSAALAALARDLSCAYLRQTGARGLIPLAWAVWAVRRLMPVQVLRRLRSVILPSRG